MPGIDFREAKARLRIVEVLQLMGYAAPRVRGGQARGPCPLHGSRSLGSRVFAVHLGKQVYHCFACGASGNALELWAAWTGQPLYAAVIEVYQRLGRDIPWLARPRRASRPSAGPQRPNQEDAMSAP